MECIVDTPINLVSWGHLAELSNLVNSGERDWAFFKADHQAEYKQLPIDPHRTQISVIAIRPPSPINDGMASLVAPWFSARSQLFYTLTSSPE